jgi:uncharacterized membrane protein
MMMMMMIMMMMIIIIIMTITIPWRKNLKVHHRTHNSPNNNSLIIIIIAIVISKFSLKSFTQQPSDEFIFRFWKPSANQKAYPSFNIAN